MCSIFDLKTNPSQLSSANQGIARSEYDQYSAHRDVTGARFSGGAIRIKFQTAGSKWWIPSKSYIRLRCEITKYDATDTGIGAQLDNADDVAPNMGLCGNLFQKADFTIAGKSISQIDSNFAELDALHTRQSKSRSWMQSIGASTNYWQDDFKVRQADVTADGEVINEVQPVAPDVVEDRVTLGFDAPGVINRNTAAYDPVTGVVTFDQNGGQNLPGDVRLIFTPGSYFVYTDGTTNPNAKGIQMKVITGIQGAGAGSATTIVVEPLVVALEDGTPALAAAFSKVTKGDVVANASRRKGKVELIWQPPLSIFKVPHAIPGGGDMELVLYPQTRNVFQKLAVESLTGDKDSGADFSFHVTDLFFYAATVEGPRMDNGSYLLDLDETNCQIKTAGTAGLQQNQFDVSPSTHSLTMAFQDQRAGSNTLYSQSKFKVNGAASDELKLNRFFIQYDGESKPSPDADPLFVGFEDRTTQRFAETQMAIGAWMDSGGSETIQEWQDRGAYYTMQWPRDGASRATRVVTHTQFTAPIANANVLLFNHYKAVARVTMQDGQIVQVDYSQT